jgi:hypothetical protein
MCPLVLVAACCWRLQDGGGLLVRRRLLLPVGRLLLGRPLLLVPLMPLRLELLFFLTWKREDGPTGRPLPLCPLPLGPLPLGALPLGASTPLGVRATATVRQVVAYQDQGAVAGDGRLGLDGTRLPGH